MRFLPVALLLCFVLPSCHKSEVGDARIAHILDTLEIDASAGLIRQLVADCPYNEPKRKLCIVLGREQFQPREAFIAQLPEFQDRLLKHNQVTVTNVGGVTRVMEKTTGVMAGDLIMLIQISEIQSTNGSYQAVGAWAYKDDVLRRKYTVTPQSDGKFNVVPGDILEQKTGSKETGG